MNNSSSFRQRKTLLGFSDKRRSNSTWRIAVMVVALTAASRADASDHTNEFESVAKDTSVHYLAEISKRRRLTTIFPNQQTPFNGVQIGMTNVSERNLTFLHRDLVRLDILPIVMGRVYDSRIQSSDDFGPGWRLPFAETISQHGSRLSYVDASNSKHELKILGTQIFADFPTLVGIDSGFYGADKITFNHLGLEKEFQRLGDRYVLVNVHDKFGHSIKIDYDNGLVSQIMTSSGRFVRLTRGSSGLITSATDDVSRTVKYRYDNQLRLIKYTDIGGNSWRYVYGLNGQLIEIVDPKGNPTLQATYDNGDPSTVKVMHEEYKFTYNQNVTSVSNSQSQTAVFWSHPAGLTETVQDFSGGVSNLHLNEDLKVTDLEFNGQLMMSIEYDTNKRPKKIVRATSDGQTILEPRFSNGYLTSIDSDGSTIAKYQYGEHGVLLLADDNLGKREYKLNDQGQIQALRTRDSAVRIEPNEFGGISMLRFSNGSSIEFRTNRFDQILEMKTRDEDRRYDHSFTYNNYGFRESALYFQGLLGIDFDYDISGNMSHVSFINESGMAKEDTYQIGYANQLEGILGQTGPDITFEYDNGGKPVRIQQDGRTAEVSYDDLNRMIAVTVEDEELFRIEYGPMDQDAVYKADHKSSRTRIDAPAASAVFGSINAIAYTRPVGSPYGPIFFDDQMARFIFETDPIAPPDAVLLDSLKRRMIPFDGNKLYVSPFAFDKPSNSLFIPPEFFSVNCYTCIGAVTAADIEVNGSDLPTYTSVGVNVKFDVTADGACFYHGLNPPPPGSPPSPTQPPTPPPANFTHLISYGDGGGTTKTSGSSPNTSFNRTYNSTGVKVASDIIKCSCTASPFAISQASHTVVVVPANVTPIQIVLTFDDGPTSASPHNSRTAINTLKTNSVQNSIESTFFVQTHVPNRGGHPEGILTMQMALANNNKIMIHTGSESDHTLHTTRVTLPPYDANGDGVVNSADGLNTLEGDMIRAKLRIASLVGGTTPTQVRAPTGATNSAVLSTYTRQNLTHKLWDVDSGDSMTGATHASITAALNSQIPQQLSAGKTKIVVLFHDIKGVTVDNLNRDAAPKGYLQTIRDAIVGAGDYLPVFSQL